MDSDKDTRCLTDVSASLIRRELKYLDGGDVVVVEGMISEYIR